MKLDKLVKTLRRDLAANPMKAGVLGILLLGGLYFWGPLVWKWVAKKGPASASAAAVIPSATHETVGTQNAGLQPTGTEEKQEPDFVWRQVRDRRESDPFARSANFRPEWSHIFQVAAAVTAAKPEVEVTEPKPVEVDPRQLGLVLQGVAISPRANRAVINGKVYRELDWITVKQTSNTTNNQEAPLPDLKFRLVRVYRKMVELQRGGKTWAIKLASTELDKQASAEVTRVRQPREEPEKEPTDEKAAKPAMKEAATVKE